MVKQIAIDVTAFIVLYTIILIILATMFFKEPIPDLLKQHILVYFVGSIVIAIKTWIRIRNEEAARLEE